MGGYGSGGHNKLKYHVEGLPCIDIRGYTKVLPKENSSLAFTLEFSNYRSIGGKIYSDRITLTYSSSNTTTGEKTKHNYDVYFDYTINGYGKRRWFICPHCGRRTAKLYLKDSVFFCRVCQNVNYISSQISGDKAEELARKIYKIQKKLKAERDISNYYNIPRPKGMHETTYRRLMYRLQYLGDKRCKVFDFISRNFLIKVKSKYLKPF